MKHFLLLAVIATLVCTCKKDDQNCPPDLPCATQIGANTFGCYINGKPWVAEIAPYVLDPSLHKISATYDELEYGDQHLNILYFIATRVDSFSYDFINMTFSPILSEGDIRHHLFDIFRIEARLETTTNKHHLFKIDTLSAYEVQLTKLDLEKNIVSCKFAFTAVTSAGLDSIVVTNGRFDLKYDPY